jgi:hypothetical protein
MWDRAGKAAREAREFANLHALTFHTDTAPDLPASADAHPFESHQRRHAVSGEWRGRAVQRFSTSEITVELMTLAGVLPRLQVIPSGLERGALAVGGRVAITGDLAFDSRWTVRTDDVEFALAFLNPRIREALLHPAAAGRALVVDGESLYLWGPGELPWSEARVRFEFLSVIVGRIDAGVWQRFDARTQAPGAQAEAVWLPGEEVDEDVQQFVVAPLPVENAAEPGVGEIGDTGEFEVALLNAELAENTFLPQPEDPESSIGSWVGAPVVRA